MKTPKLYIGLRNRKTGVAQVFVESPNVEAKPLRLIGRHSPTGFEWGFAGSGPAELALCILADYLGDESIDGPAWKLHQHFKDAFIVNKEKEGWLITSSEIDRWLKERKNADTGEDQKNTR